MNSIFINYGYAFDKCNRKYMEDFNKIYISNNIKYFSICDGHGDDLVSKYVNDSFFVSFQENLHHLKPYNYYNFFAELAINLDNEIRLNQYIGYLSGTTYISVIIYDNNIYFINIGDSVVTLNINNNIIYKNLRHTPNIYIERQRITKTSKIINNRINGILNVSRGFGDFYLKPKIHSNKNPVSCLPDVKKINIDMLFGNKAFIILASDGILLHLSLEIINTYVYKMLCLGYDPQIISDKIVEYYKKKNNEDNITIIIITFNNFKT